MNTDQPTPVIEENTETKTVHLEPGTILKQKREQLGLSKKQVADRLRLRVAMIEQIENNEFEPDQVATFTRGYLRSYAKVVSVDEREVLAALDESIGSQPPQEQEMKSFSRKTNRERHDSRIMAITWGIVIVIVAISSIWWWQNQQKDVVELTGEDDAALVTETVNQPLEIERTIQPSDYAVEEVQPASNNEAFTPAAEENTPSTSSDTTLPSLEAVPVNSAQATSQESAVTDAQTQAPTVATNVDNSNSMQLSFNDECWVQVKDATGKTILNGIKGAGESVTVEGKKPYNIILGAPENVSITLASEPVDLSGYTAGKAARFTLP
ncbi:cytoskeleton protein RodZ [Vibrio kasasachensis]|uniref:cytoskeleton protein RodZ n=1 Tax=Vibrio kasasachensis TaxID=2910248 RepID=UPI003D0C1B2D